jgi:tryptophanyl-tRNA synthetase
MATPKRVILSGMRPTGKLHLGNYVGALDNWVKIQNEPDTQCFFMVADWHALTTDYEDPQSIESSVEDMVTDWLAAGLDPQKSVIFRQSWVREHAELSLVLSMITPLSWLERNPTYKDQIKELEGKDIRTHGFLGYPVLQAADILLYRATHVPVGEDQLPHLELTREIARRFNFLYKEPILVEPQAILSRTPKVLGTDARKMSKSYDNCVYLSDPEPALKKKVNSMFTDPNKIKADDKGHPLPSPENPSGCAVFALHEVLGEPPADLKKREKDCMAGALACSPCKAALTERLNRFLEPLRARARHEKSLVKQILREGSARASEKARQVMWNVLDKIGFPNGEAIP